MSVKRKKQFTVWLENKPGQMARLGRALRKGKINILALSVVDSVDASQVRIVVDDAPALRKALAAAKMPSSTRDVLVLELANIPGAMGRIGDTLSKAGLNLDYAYGSTHPAIDDAQVVIACDDVPRAAKLLS